MHFASVAYPIAGIAFTLALFGRNDTLEWTLAAIVTAVSAGRIVFLRAGRSLLERDAVAWRRTFATSTLLSILAWSSFVAITIARFGVDESTMLLLLFSSGMAATATYVFAPDRTLLRAVLLVGIVPPVIGVLSVGTPLAFVLAGLMSVSLAYHFQASGRIYQAHWRSIDIARQLAERERAHALLATAVEHADDAIVILTADGGVSYVNDAFVAMSGFHRTALVAPNASTPIEATEGGTPIGDALEALKANGVWRGEVQVVRREHEPLVVEATMWAVREDGGAVTHAVVQAKDVALQRQAEQRLRLGDRLVAVGTLAAGVAHEVNNPLSYVMANLEIASEEIGAAIEQCRAAGEHAIATQLGQVLEPLAEAHTGGGRIRDIVRGMLALSRDSEPLAKPLHLPDVIETAVRLAANEIRHRATLIKNYRPTPLVLADEGRLVQVMLNLLLNAAHAIREGNAEQNRIEIEAHTDEQGRAVVRVRDTGGGMSPEVRKRVFDPFYTTKAIGQGTGLGLAVCEAFVSSAGGEISVESEVGRGTTFTIALPAAEAAPTPEVSPVEERARPEQTARGHVLVVDDEPMVGVAIKRLLQRDHDVEVASSAVDALDLLTRAEFDVILSDVMMPQMTGPELVEAIARRSPQHAARIVLMTGGAFATPTRESLDKLPNERLAKPIDPGRLRELVRNRVSALRAAPV